MVRSLAGAGRPRRVICEPGVAQEHVRRNAVTGWSAVLPTTLWGPSARPGHTGHGQGGGAALPQRKGAYGRGSASGWHRDVDWWSQLGADRQGLRDRVRDESLQT